MPDDDIKLNEKEGRMPVIEIANAQVGLSVSNGIVALLFRPHDEHMTMVLHGMLKDAIHRGCAHMHFAPVISSGVVTLKEG